VLVPPDYDGAANAAREKREIEAEQAGNSTNDLAADWHDYDAARMTGDEDLTQRALDIPRTVDMEIDIYELRLRGTVDPRTRPDLASRILDTRAAFRDRLADLDLAPLVEVFDRDLYNDNTTVGENLLFGRPAAFDLDRLGEHTYVLEILEKAALTNTMMEAGRQVTFTMVELFTDLPQAINSLNVMPS